MKKDRVRELAFKHAVINAVKYGGKADFKAVISKLFREDPSLKPYARDIVPIVRKVVEEVNKRKLEELRKILEEKWPGELSKREKGEGKKSLPPLPNVDKFKQIVTRFAPNPDFVLHLGSARPAILSYEYARMYNGKFILRFEDTDPKTKTPILEAYEAIREDLRWLGLKWDEEYIQSLRMDVYYHYARELIKKGGAYVCTCPHDKIRDYRKRGIACEHSMEEANIQLERWDKMLEGAYGEGEAVLRVRTDMKYPDPSVRDWIAFRIIDTSKNPHPLVGDKYIVWPTYNFACGVDDHLMKVSHILRAKEHQTNTIKQKYMYRHLGWEYPEAIHFGRLNLEGMILSKSKIRKGIEEGRYLSWDDPRLGTLISLRKRGFLPETVWEIMIDVGVKSSSAVISLANLCAVNRKYIEPRANRYMFVPNPVEINLVEIPEKLIAKIPYHPSFPDRGFRSILITPDNASIFIPGEDLESLKNKEVRFLGLANFKLEIIKDKPFAKYLNDDTEYAKRRKLPIIQWVPVNRYVRVEVVKVENEDIVIIKGVGEEDVGKLKVDDKVQFYRFGFVRIDENLGDRVKAYFTHE
ncbi:MAG: glutamate--tRNA ligase [Thermoprotei archaeon]|nr:MAG: glutamate--tRNA ligase [Thermoprotei archaeon]